MNGSGEVARNPISRTLSADFVSTTEPLRAFGETVARAWKWLTRHSQGVLARGASRRLKVAETVSLGEKRFVSILQVDGEQFLVGGSASNIVLLAKLDRSGAGAFENVFSLVGSAIGTGEPDRKKSAEVTR